MSASLSLSDSGAQAMVGPVKATERIPIIDIWRGFAIFGILLVNLEMFNHAVQDFSLGLEASGGALNQAARWFIAFFGEAKFYSIFAFLFGLGLAMQQQRAVERGQPFAPLFLRRMFILLGIGLVHAYLIWFGDILIMYAVMGLLLFLLFRNRQPKTLRRWFFIMLLVPLLINGALWGLIEFSSATPEGAAFMADMFAEQQRELEGLRDAANATYAGGSFAEITRQRAADMSYMYTIWPFMAFNVLAMFVLGLYAGKIQLHRTIADDAVTLRKVFRWGLLIGLSGNALYVVFGEMALRLQPTPALLVSLTGQTFGAPALGLAYLAGLGLLARRERWLRRLQPLAAVGRMAITNYLLQSIICTLLFYGYGLGLYGRISTTGGILFALALYGLQIPFSVWWLKRFRFGPVEWLWRSLTYLKAQPLRVRPAVA